MADGHTIHVNIASLEIKKISNLLHKTIKKFEYVGGRQVNMYTLFFLRVASDRIISDRIRIGSDRIKLFHPIASIGSDRIDGDPIRNPIISIGSDRIWGDPIR